MTTSTEVRQSAKPWRPGQRLLVGGVAAGPLFLTVAVLQLPFKDGSA